jgi:hypothetical protein
MANADQTTIDELKRMLAIQLEIERDRYGLKHNISGTDLKDHIAAALSQCRGALQSLVDSLGPS